LEVKLPNRTWEAARVVLAQGGTMQCQVGGDDSGNSATALSFATTLDATFAGTIKALAATTAKASINIAEGVAPTSPVDGDTWVTAAGEFMARLNGVSVNLAGAAGVEYTLQAGTSYTAVVGDFVVASNTGTVTINLPSGHSADETIVVKKTGATGTVTIDANASETIDGALTLVLSNQYSLCNFYFRWH